MVLPDARFNVVYYKVKIAREKWKKEPADSAASGKRIPKGPALEKIGENDDGSWIHLRWTLGDGSSFTGWLKLDQLEETEAPERPDIDLFGFLKTCVRAELAVNALSDTEPHFINADFLIALALYESKIQNVGEKTPGTGLKHGVGGCHTAGFKVGPV